MPWIRVYCKNPTCRAEFKVDKGVPSRDCHKCGVTHSQPWEEHDPRMEPPEDNYPPVLVCEGCFEEFDVRREPSCEYQKNMFRCPHCRKDHSHLSADDPTRDPPGAVEPEVVDAEPVAADGGANPAALIDELRRKADDEENAELHVHFHMDG